MTENPKRSLSDFPEEIITEILVRLPVKSVLQCKSVCKPWLHTISNPNFIKSHLHHAITASRYDPTLLNIINVEQLAYLAASDRLFHYADPAPAFLQMQQRQRRRRQLVNQALDDADAQDLSGSPLQFARVDIPGGLKLSRFVGCCNGIICLCNFGNGVYFWNPSIKMFRQIVFTNPGRKRSAIVGFGHDRISNEYKLLRFVYERRDDVVPMAKVDYVNAGYCREFQGPNLKTQICPVEKSNIVVNNVLYFFGGDQLVSFDLHNEVFGLVVLPNFIQRKMSNVMDFEGSVAIVFESGTGVDLWTLNTVSGVFSWNKKFSIEYGLDDLDTEIWLSCYLGAKQFYGWKSLNGNYFVYEILYDYEKKNIKYYGLREEYVNIYQTSEESEKIISAKLEDSMVPVHAAFKYTETLVSLDRFEPVENARNEQSNSWGFIHES
ncbi:hypothetical protein DCAR_0521052 [Daucus carota subsp. sativus]|uniref:F-box domain-containing protein n=1 Tax=Daucus carota subsp. sativus TaxID=79200 RepID=A0AAF0X727_DAUCS|nr:PREDICTED: F-box/kelch-repeat protein At3g23880-like [Daucus carota subsp. sativus]WOH01667.1 hypothetical protein DCAR_0521052 [Daucus carota subsp. sativus]